MKTALASRLRRRYLTAWATFLARALAATGLLLAGVFASLSHSGLMSLGFLTVAALVGIGVGRARREMRRAGGAIQLHRLIEETLSPLARRGWHLKHNVRWPEGPGDGHLAMNPSGELAFAIKDCTATIADFDLAQTQDFATALSETGRPYVPVCVAPASDERSFTDRGIVCCTPERLVAELLDAEGAFAASLRDEVVRRDLLYSESSLN